MKPSLGKATYNHHALLRQVVQGLLHNLHEAGIQVLICSPPPPYPLPFLDSVVH